jgi:N6-L-threonylcarbamoyladenine synthase
LGIETTCDETAAAVLAGDGKLLSNIVYSQIFLHKKFSGVIPELASRAHSEKISAVISKALERANRQKPLAPLSAVCFASGPGLSGALLVGKIAAETIAKIYNIPVFGVNHLEGHLFACELEDVKFSRRLKFPLIALIVSGGHSELWRVKGHGSYKMLGATRDDAAGEAFDKVAKLLKLGYPGGPAVEKCALKCKKNAVKFPRPKLEGSWDFSFSGLKTAVSYYMRDNKKANAACVCAGFQSAVVDTLVSKTVFAAEKYGVKNILIGGGVSANSSLKASMAEVCKKQGFNLLFAQKKYCSDNGAMIALAGYRKISSQVRAGDLTSVKPNLKIKNWRSLH